MKTSLEGFFFLIFCTLSSCKITENKFKNAENESQTHFALSASQSFEETSEVLSFFAQDSIAEGAWNLSESFASDGKKSVKITMRPGDKLVDGRERAELRDLKLPLNTEIWQRVDMLLPKDFPIRKNNLVLMQVKQDGDNNPIFSIRFSEGKMFARIRFDNKQLDYPFEEKIPARGLWNTFILHTKCSRQEGFIQLWLNDELLVDYRGPSAFKDEGERTYFKFGPYRDQSPEEMVVYFDHFQRGISAEDVGLKCAFCALDSVIKPKEKTK